MKIVFKNVFLPQNNPIMINIHYGESNFKKLVVNDFFYQDRTQYIPLLEQWQCQYQVFLRPRRFGKSLFISILQHYYGVNYAADFQTLFGKCYIGKHPTPDANQYMILRFEFSRIDTSTQERTYAGFLSNTIMAVRDFLSTYKGLFTKEEKGIILGEKSPEGVVKHLFSFFQTKEVKHKIYVLIDEYDHFANELLSFDIERFKSNVSGNGFVRKFYETFKNATGEGIIGRIFITGVSPVTLDSLTSGFNISDNITLNPIFHNMMGFTAAEVEIILRQSDIPSDTIPVMMNDLTEWYDGYCFTPDADTHLYNPDMLLYFLKEYNIAQKYPYKMLDMNIISDYRKISSIFKIGGDERGKFELLKELLDTGYIDFDLTRLYNLELEFSEGDFLSLLFYMGILSFREVRNVSWRFEIPNYVIKKLYFEYFISMYLVKTSYSVMQRKIARTIDALIGDGNPEPFFQMVEHVLAENHSNRDNMNYGEKHLQTLMIGLLCPYDSYFIHSEYEAKKGHPDLFLERMPNRPIPYEIVLELKYLKKKEVKKLPDVIQQAEFQLDKYMNSARFARPDVKGFYLVFLGGKMHRWREWGNY
jgi:hypothetical protein